MAIQQGRPWIVGTGASVLLLAGAIACSNAAVSPPLATDDLLRNDLDGDSCGAALLADADVLGVSPAMREFLDRHVSRGGPPEATLRQLVAAIVDSKTFGLEYDDRTRTASETFATRRGNCLSFSTMFVAMARGAGLAATYQEVDVPPDWTLDRETYVLNQHVNVHVDLGAAGTRVVDFNIGDFKSTYDLRRISDARALAHYYNNLGVESMQSGETAAAYALFRRAIADGDRDFSPAWTNLGTLYLRNGRPREAEAAYLEALRAAPGDLVPMSNLARLYELAGDRERAARYRMRVNQHRKRNPYYRYELARRAYADGRFDEAIDHLVYASRKRPREDEFYFLLGLSCLRKGDRRSAQRWLARAEQVAATDALKRKYSSKIDILLRSKE